jgi:type VI protein secretion system component VasF
MSETPKNDAPPAMEPAPRARQAERTGLWRILTISVVGAVVALGLVWVAAA